MSSIIEIQNVEKVYEGGFQALKNINLEVEKGEIFALLGPNGAGKTTLISIICGINTLTSGKIFVGEACIEHQYREARGMIGLVPQELTTNAFETVWNTVAFSRGLFGKKRNDEYIGQLLKDLSLWDKRNNQLRTLSGGMKRRVMIAKALAHEPQVLFLDEPTAGVDVELRKGMWEQVAKLRESGVTIILTTHYLEEAEQMADRIGVINHGEITLVEEKSAMIRNLGTKKLRFDLAEPMGEIPQALQKYNLSVDGSKLTFTYDEKKEGAGAPEFLDDLKQAGVRYTDLATSQSSLEEIFVQLVKKS